MMSKAGGRGRQSGRRALANRVRQSQRAGHCSPETSEALMALKGKNIPQEGEEETEGQDGGDRSAVVSVYLVLGRHNASGNSLCHGVCLSCTG